MALIIKIFISLFKRNYYLTQLYIITQDIEYLGIFRYLKT
jgi:hypothetical protein